MTAAAAIYVRVSTEDQGWGYSLPTQIEACQKLAEAEGYHVPTSYTFEEDHTGTVLERPLLPRLRDLVRAQAITAIICYDPDRLARRFAHQMILDEEMERVGIRALFVKHQAEDSPEGRLFSYMRGALSEYELEKIRERP